MRKLLLLVLVAALAAFAAGCGSDDEEATPPAGDTATEAADPCAKESLETRTAGRLTIGTDNPAYPPWFEIGEPATEPWELGDPTNGEGFESAVAYAVAGELGFSEDEVDWTVVPFDQSFRPGPKDFDFDINQISYSDERAQAVNFSDSYYDVNQALVALQANKIADAQSIAELKDAKLGAPVGTTSYQYIVDNIEPSSQPSVYNTLNDAISAVKAKQIDGVVVDLPTAFFITAAQLENSTIVGQFPAVGEQEYFAMALEQDSPLVDCVDAALARLKDGGRLAEIQQEWLSDKADAPVLE
ncbi:MAG: ABC transporter substrate-binding protein [Gaiellaceae bacterium]